MTDPALSESTPTPEGIKSRALEEILQEMARHTEENPTHGHNCACKDKLTTEFRLALGWPTTQRLIDELRLAVSYIR